MRDAHEALGFRGVDGILAGQLDQRIDVEGFAQRQQPQGLDRQARLVQPVVEQRRQPRRHRGSSAQLPHPVDVGERARLHGPFDEVTQEQRVAARGLPHDVGGQPLQGATEHGLHQGNALGLRQRRQIQALEVAVLPQRGHGVGHRLAAAHGGHDAPDLLDGDVVQQRRGELVEQMRVVDTHDGTLALEQGLAGVGEQRDRVAGPGAAHPGRERAKGDAAGGLGARRPAHRRAQWIGVNACQRGLSDPGGSDQDDAARGGRGQRLADQPRFVGALKQLPVGVHVGSSPSVAGSRRGTWL
jgi:hypothetical protein